MSPNEIRRLKGECLRNPARFNRRVLGRPAYWHRQAEICRSLIEHNTTLVPAGNGVGKSFVSAGLLHWFLQHHPGCRVIATAPSQVQLEEVLWKEVERAYHGARIPLGGRLLKSPLKVDLGDGWDALAYSTTKTERLSGHHRGHLLAILDEASGIEPEIVEAIDSCNPSRTLMCGNPLRPDGAFYERCQSAGKNRLVNLIRISSLESPDIHLERSPRGLADATWLEKSRNDYGEGSLWWLPHVLALFPDSADDAVLPRSWLDRAGSVVGAVVLAGHRRLAIDLAGGNGGDRSVLLVRDDRSILDLDHSNTWPLEETARRAALLVAKWGVDPSRVTWDASGLGIDFANRLESAGIVGATAYRGGNPGGTKYGNLRSACAWAIRQRLDPHRVDATGRPQPPFSIRPDWLALMREELQGLRYTLDSHGRVTLERKEDFVKRLKRSPDFADTLGQSFAFPNT